MMELQLGERSMQLLPDKAILDVKSRTLILADLHLGKTQHFRKHGISIPQQSAERDYLRLEQLIARINPRRIILLGDLFHSDHNNEWKLFCDFVNERDRIEFILVMGNHDILDRKQYKNVCLTLVEEQLEEGDIIYSHKPMKKVPEGKINFAGHIHPGFKLYGRGKQSIALPCFYKTPQQLILPAFGSLTGLAMVRKVKGAEIFVIANEEVIRV